MVQSWYGGWNIWVCTESASESHIVLLYEWLQNYFKTKEPVIPQLRQLKPFLEQMAMACILWMEKWEIYWTVFSCRKTWLKSRWSNPKRKITIKNTQSLRILMASGVRLTYMSKLDMHSVTLKVRDIQVWQPSMAPALVSLAGESTPKL